MYRETHYAVSYLDHHHKSICFSYLAQPNEALQGGLAHPLGERSG